MQTRFALIPEHPTRINAPYPDSILGIGVVTERDARPIPKEIQDTRTSAVILTLSEDGTVKLKLEFEKSSDLEVWENQGKSIEAGYPLAQGKEFLSFALK